MAYNGTQVRSRSSSMAGASLIDQRLNIAHATLEELEDVPEQQENPAKLLRKLRKLLAG